MFEWKPYNSKQNRRRPLRRWRDDLASFLNDQPKQGLMAKGGRPLLSYTLIGKGSQIKSRPHPNRTSKLSILYDFLNLIVLITNTQITLKIRQSDGSNNLGSQGGKSKQREHMTTMGHT